MHVRKERELEKNNMLHCASLKPLYSFEYLRIDNLAYYRLYRYCIKDRGMQGVTVGNRRQLT